MVFTPYQSDFYSNIRVKVTLNRVIFTPYQSDFYSNIRVKFPLNRVVFTPYQSDFTPIGVKVTLLGVKVTPNRVVFTPEGSCSNCKFGVDLTPVRE